jgi:hypothetical protein
MKTRISLLVLSLLGVTASAQAQSTQLSMRSDPGDFIGGGQDHLYTVADGTFIARKNFDNGVSIAFNTPTFSHFWHLDFAAPHAELLTPGLYAGAVRFPFQPDDVPGLDVSGDGRGCNMLTGTFQVHEVVYGAADDVTAFRATFEQHCEGAAPALRGEIRFNATVPIELTAPTQVSVVEGTHVTFPVTAVDISGRTVVLSATGLPMGASFIDHGNNTGLFNWPTMPGQAGAYTVAFHADNLNGAVETVFTRIVVLAPPPVNDEFENAIVVPHLPFAATGNTEAATTAIDDPFCSGRSATVWFSFTAPANMRVEADTFGSGYDTTLSVYTGSRPALMQMACNDNADGTLQSRVRFNASAGVTYFFMISAFSFPGAGGPLSFNIKDGPPPLSVDANLFRHGSVSASTGAAALQGSVTCSQPAFVNLFGQFRQEYGNAIVTGFFGTSIPCDGTTPWSTNVFVMPTLKRGRAVALPVGGPATVTLTMFAFDPETGEFVQRNIEANVIMRGRP